MYALDELGPYSSSLLSDHLVTDSLVEEWVQSISVLALRLRSTPSRVFYLSCIFKRIIVIEWILTEMTS